MGNELKSDLEKAFAYTKTQKVSSFRSKKIEPWEDAPYRMHDKKIHPLEMIRRSRIYFMGRKNVSVGRCGDSWEPIELEEPIFLVPTGNFTSGQGLLVT